MDENIIFKQEPVDEIQEDSVPLIPVEVYNINDLDFIKEETFEVLEPVEVVTPKMEVPSSTSEENNVEEPKYSNSHSSEVSSDESSRALHLRKSFNCSFPGCGKKFAKNIKLTYHMRRHTNERPFVCDVLNCNKSYAYPNHLGRHKDTSHSQNLKEPLPCFHEGCFLKFANKDSLNKHVKRKHDPNRESRYKRTHSKEGFPKKKRRAWKCTIDECKCEQTFERRSDLLKHKKMYEVSNLKCIVCNRTFKHKGDLTQHLETHTVVAARVFICGYENCDREYSYKKNLISHINKRHKKIEKPRVKCTYPGCDSTFSKNQNLKRHLELAHRNKKVVWKKERKIRKPKGFSKNSFTAVFTDENLPDMLQKNS